MFAVQTDLARKNRRALQAEVSPSEKAQLERKPTENSDAYLAFIQAHNLQAAMEDLEKLKQGRATLPASHSARSEICSRDRALIHSWTAGSSILSNDD